jgi:hypothetical protein
VKAVCVNTGYFPSISRCLWQPSFCWGSEKKYQFFDFSEINNFSRNAHHAPTLRGYWFSALPKPQRPNIPMAGSRQRSAFCKSYPSKIIELHLIRIDQDASSARACCFDQKEESSLIGRDFSFLFQLESTRERSPHKLPLPTSTRIIGFCVRWVCICSSSSRVSIPIERTQSALRSFCFCFPLNSTF